jgi:hypothetical protein
MTHKKNVEKLKLALVKQTKKIKKQIEKNESNTNTN